MFNSHFFWKCENFSTNVWECRCRVIKGSLWNKSSSRIVGCEPWTKRQAQWHGCVESKCNLSKISGWSNRTKFCDWFSFLKLPDLALSQSVLNCEVARNMHPVDVWVLEDFTQRLYYLFFAYKGKLKCSVAKELTACQNGNCHSITQDWRRPRFVNKSIKRQHSPVFNSSHAIKYQFWITVDSLFLKVVHFRRIEALYTFNLWLIDAFPVPFLQCCRINEWIW